MLSALLLSAQALAGPPAMQTVAPGTAVVPGNSATGTNSAGAITNWSQFNIPSSDASRYIQPTSSSAVNNRVLTSDPTQIYGTLSTASTLPSGANLVGGAATITTTANTMTITQSSQRAIINWNSFNIGTGNTVQFVQPSSSSATLNRVTSLEPSLLSGQLTANGQVFLINPSGIAVTATGSVHAGGVMLSTVNVRDAEFLQGAVVYESVAPDIRSNLMVDGSIVASGEVALVPAHYLVIGSLPQAKVVTLDAPDIHIDFSASSGTTVFSDTLANLALGNTGPVTSNNTFGGVGHLVATGPLSVGPSAPNTPPVISLTSWPKSNAVPSVAAASALASGPVGILTSSGVPVTRSSTPINGPRPASLPAAPNVPSLIDGAVVVRMPLVDFTPIALR